MLVDVVVDLSNVYINRPFTYNLDTKKFQDLKLGQRVVVNFRNRRVTAFIVKIYEGENDKYKYVEDVIDEFSLFNDELFKLVISLSNEFVLPYASVFKMMLPNILNKSYKSYLKIIDNNGIDETTLSLFKNDILEVKKKNFLTTKIKSYIKSNKLELIYDFNINFKNKTEKIVRVLDKNVKTVKQKELLNIIDLGTNRLASLKELGFENVVKTLVKNGNLIYSQQEVVNSVKKEILHKDIVLTEKQTQVVNSILEKRSNYSTNLLHGVTGSGKTEVYLELLRNIIKVGKTAFLLVPEINLTYQIVKRVFSVSNRVSVIHSKLTEKEQFIEYQKIKNNEIDIVIGTRSSIFMPLENVGVIIIDEAHSNSYFQDTAPSYHLRDVAILRAKYNSCPLILGTATPSVVDYTRAKKHLYNLYELNERPHDSLLPIINIVDMKESEDKLISKELDEAIRLAISLEENIIILHNRVGYSNFLICETCGKVKKCNNCDISLTYYKNENVLRCSYCNKVYPLTACECGSRVKFIGYGTEQIAEVLESKYNVKILRMDKFTTKVKGSAEKIIKEFEKSKSTILLGTTLVSKGLDFDNVNLVGVINADISLNLSSFNSGENTFQLLEQVSGRSGRRKKQGQVYIQTLNSEHYVFNSLGNYEEFYKNELFYRKMVSYPPYKKICLIEFRSLDYKTCETYTNMCHRYLKKEFKSLEIIGPSRPVITRVSNKEIFQLIIKYTDESLYSPIMNILNNKGKDVVVKVIFEPTFI